MSDVVKGVCKEKVNTEALIYILWDQVLPLFPGLLLELEFYLQIRILFALGAYFCQRF